MNRRADGWTRLKLNPFSFLYNNTHSPPPSIPPNSHPNTTQHPPTRKQRAPPRLRHALGHRFLQARGPLERAEPRVCEESHGPAPFGGERVGTSVINARVCRVVVDINIYI